MIFLSYNGSYLSQKAGLPVENSITSDPMKSLFFKKKILHQGMNGIYDIILRQTTEAHSSALGSMWRHHSVFLVFLNESPALDISQHSPLQLLSSIYSLF